MGTYREREGTYEFEGKIEFVTAKAYLVVPTIGPTQVWVPKSQIIDMSERDPDGNVMFEVTEWWATNSDMKEWL